MQEVIGKNKKIRAGVFLAGGFEAGDLATTRMEDISKMINLNFATAFNIAQKLVAHFRTIRGGKLIFIGAKSAMDFNVAGGNLAYSLSKQLLCNFSELINESEKSYGTTSHILLPATIDYSTDRSVAQRHAFFNSVSPCVISQIISNIIEGNEKITVIGVDGLSQ